MFTVKRALEWWAQECPSQTALCIDGEAVSFSELVRWSRNVGRYLSDLGIKRGDCVCVSALNTLEHAMVFFGAMQIEATTASLNFRLTSSEFAYFFSKLEPKLVFCDDERRAVISATWAGAETQVLALSEIAGVRESAAAPLAADVPDEAPVFVVGTSGSTGRPKAVAYTHRMIMTYASEFAIMEPKCAHGGKTLCFGPFSTTAGALIMMEFLSLGVTTFIESQFDALRALNLIAKEKVTTLMGVPIFFEKMAALPEFASADLSSVYFAQAGGARPSPEVAEAWKSKGVVLRQAYGGTEAGGGWAARLDTAVDEPEKCGRGGIFTRYAVFTPDGDLAPPGTIGEVFVRSACLMQGYWRDAEATADALTDGWWRTGDLGLLDEGGNLTFWDRLKQVIVSGGFQISAAELERVIGELAGVEEVAVIPVKDPTYGETPVAIVFAPGDRLTVEQVLQHCGAHLAKFKIPRHVILRTAPLPRLTAGKIAKTQLRDEYEHLALQGLGELVG